MCRRISSLSVHTHPQSPAATGVSLVALQTPQPASVATLSWYVFFLIHDASGYHNTASTVLHYCTDACKGRPNEMGAAVDYVASTVHTDSRIFCGVYIRILSVRLYCIVVWCTLHCTVQHRTHALQCRHALQACVGWRFRGRLTKSMRERRID